MVTAPVSGTATDPTQAHITQQGCKHIDLYYSEIQWNELLTLNSTNKPSNSHTV